MKDHNFTIGNTPLLDLTFFAREGKLFAKGEYENPTGSAKDRAAWYMILEAEKAGILHPGGTVIEPTSGNTGISLAAIAKTKGYRAIIVMPDSMSAERRQRILDHGAEIVLTPGKLGMSGAIRKAEELAASIPGSFIPNQFENPANALAHYETTGPEIWRQTEREVDVFVAGVGTGGTITGVGQFLKSRNPHIQVVAVEPAGSPVLSEGRAGKHGLRNKAGAIAAPSREVGKEGIAVKCPFAGVCQGILSVVAFGNDHEQTPLVCDLFCFATLYVRGVKKFPVRRSSQRQIGTAHLNATITLVVD